MKKFLSILLCVAMLLTFAVVTFAEEPTSAKIEFNDVAKRTEKSMNQTVWTENGITVTNVKGKTTVDTSFSKNRVKWNKNTTVTIAYPAMMAMEFVCEMGEDATTLGADLKTAYPEMNVVVFDQNAPFTVMVAFDSAMDSFEINMVSGATYVHSVTVYTVTPNMDSMIAQGAINAIDAIGTLTAGSNYAITAAREAYEALTDAQKAYVTNYNLLTAAEEAYPVMLETYTGDRTYDFSIYPQDTKKQNSTTYTLDNVTTLTTAAVTFQGSALLFSSQNYDSKATFEFTKSVSKIVFNIRCVNGINAASNTLRVYGSVDGTEWVQLQDIALVNAKDVSNDYTLELPIGHNYRFLKLDTLTSHQTHINSITITFAEPITPASVIEKIAAIGEVTFASEEAIEVARAFYNALTDEEKAQVTNYETLTAAEARLAELKAAAVARIGDDYFLTLAEAVAAAADGDTIMLLANTTGAGVVINKNITIDLGGFTYSFNQGVGSTGTESNGLQILKGNTVTIQNGTLNIAAEAADKFYTVIQNYANLTLTDVTVDATNADKWSLTDGDSYAVSINSGNVAFNGNTTIIANNDGALAFAFDACQKETYEIPVITVNTTGTITGNIEVTGGTLAIQAATINGTLVYASGSVTKADAVTLEAPADYKWYNGNLISKAYIARIGNTYYLTLAEAVAAAADGDTIVLVENIDLGTEMLTIKKQITIDLNGKNITSAYTGDFAALYIGTTGDLTITGEGTITAPDVAIGNYGKLTIAGGTITGTNAALYNFYYNDTTYGTATITGGKLNIAWNCGEMTVSGGEIEYIDNTHQLTVSGGTIGELEINVPDYIPEENLNNTVSGGTITNTNAVARVGNSYYLTLADAVASAAGNTVVLLKDVTLTTPVFANIDLNGHTLKGTVVGTMYMNGGTLITAEDITMAGPANAMYITENAVITMAANYDLTMVSGTVTLGADWRTLPNQKVIVAAEATVIIPEGKTFTILCDVTVEGTLTNNGSIVLGEADATLTAAEGLQLTTTAGNKVWYTEGKYIVHNHTVVTDEAKDATCTETGLTEGSHCSVCNDILVKQEETPLAKHTEVIDEGKDATCTETGLTEGKHCSECGEVLVKQEETPLAKHTEVIDEAKDATCTETGLTEGKHCSECGEVLVKQEETPIIDHEYENGVCTGCGIQQAIDPTNDGTLIFFIIAMMSVAGLVVLVCKKKIF